MITADYLQNASVLCYFGVYKHKDVKLEKFFSSHMAHKRRWSLFP